MSIIDGAKIEKEMHPERFFGTWIPCKEKLPEEHGFYLVTYEKRFIPDNADDVDHYKTIGIMFYNKKECRWGIWNDCEVYAWMPLPKMYEGD